MCVSVLVGSATVFAVSVLANRSWLAAEQRKVLVTNASGLAALVERLGTDPTSLEGHLESVQASARVAVEVDGRWYGTSRESFGDLTDARLAATTARSGITYIADATASESLIAIPVTIGGRPARFYQLADHGTWDARRNRTWRIVGLSIFTIAAIAAGAGALAGRRLSRPLGEAAAAARRVAAGGLGTRLPDADDPALSDLTTTFNEMVETLVARTESDRRFNSDVSHELRSPLTTLVASLAVLQSRRHELSPANRVALDLLDADLQRFTRLVDDLLEMSRFDGGAATMIPSTVNVSEFLESVVEATGRTDLNLVISPMLRVFDIELDKRRIARVISNLIDNAYAHGTRPVWLNAIELPPGDTSPTHVRISVEDRGAGVDLDRSDELFERFNRGSRQSGSSGSGLGLALAREHVLLHGGTIHFAPLPRGITGTCITVVLPLRQADHTHRGRTTLRR